MLALKLCAFVHHSCCSSSCCTVLLLLLSPSSASHPSEPSDELAELTQLELVPLTVDGALAHHLQHCPYHLRLLKTQLMCGQELPECLYGQPLWSAVCLCQS